MKPLTLALSIFVFAFTAKAQDLVQNWSDKTHDHGVQDPGTVRLVIEGTNSFYYYYSISTTSTSQDQSVFDAVSQYFPAQKLSALQSGCGSLIKAVVDDMKKMKVPTRDDTSHVYNSIALSDTIGDWNSNVDDAYNAAYAQCTPDERNKPDFKKIEAARDLLFPANNGVPSVTTTIDTKPCKNYTVILTEVYEGSPTAAKNLTATFSTQCDRVTFSGGPLFTEIGNPTYASRPIPGSATQFLSVENSGQFRATLTGLVNINMPWHSDARLLDPFRLGISTGPVFQNSQSGGSSFGWVAGPSLSVYKYVYLTAGAHWGDFPDTPFGFQNNGPIPANFGTLTPVFRHTWRFALGLTFKTTDISKVFSGGNVQATGSVKPTQQPAAPVPAPK